MNMVARTVLPGACLPTQEVSQIITEARAGAPRGKSEASA